jgi:glycosyltransferase involved in cell wall biosynthesis
MRILIITDSIPRADFDSGYRRLAAMMEHMGKQHSLALIARHIRENIPERDRAAQHMRSIGVTQLWEGEWALAHVLRKQRFDLAIFHYYAAAVWAMEPFRRANPGARTIVDSGDLHYIREETAAAIGAVTREHAAAVRQTESRVYQAADLVITNSGEDDVIFRREFPQTPSVMVANMVPMRPRPKMARASQLFFVGNFFHKPNVDGIVWFADSILPLVLQQRPDTILEIGGRNPPPELAKLPSASAIRALGWIPDTNPHLDAARAVIAPLRFGGGMKGKVTESLASAVPTVTTTFGAQGFNATNGVHLRVEDDPAAFAAAVVDVLDREDAAEKMGRAGQELVRALCSPEVVQQKIDEALATVARATPKPARRPGSRFQFVLGSLALDFARRLQRFGAEKVGLE